MRIAVALSVALALVTLVAGAAYSLLLSTSVPIGDIVDFYHQFMEADGFAGYGLSELFRWHNEHRLVVPKLWFLADIALVDGRQSLLRAVIFLSALLHAGLLALLFRSLGHSVRTTGLAALVAAAAFVSPVQYENLLNGFQVQFVQVWLFATIALALLAWAPAREDRPLAIGLCVVGAVLGGLASTYSMFNGVAVWPLLVVFAFWRRLPLGWCLLLAAVGGAVVAAQITGFLARPGAGGGYATGIDLFTVLLFMGRYLASALGQIGTLGQEVVGIAAMAAVVAGGLHALFRPASTPPARMALYAVGAFLMVAALATALGRLHIGLGAADSSRYTTPSMLFLVTTGLLAFDLLLRTGRRQAIAVSLGVGVVVLLVPGLVHGLRGLPHRLAARDLAELTVVSHLAAGYRPDTLLHIYPEWPPRTTTVLDGMRRFGIGPFSEIDRFHPPQGALADGPAVETPLCDGSAERLRIDPVTGVTVSAWLADAESGRRAPWLVVRSTDGKVLAWGAALEPRGDRVPIPEPGMFERGLRGFGPAPEAMVDSAIVEGVFADGTRCRLPGTVAALPDRYIAELPVGARPALPDGWTFEGEPLAGGTGDTAVPDAARPVYGSMGLNDRRFAASATLGVPGEARGVLLPLRSQNWPFGTTIILQTADGVTLDDVTLTRPVRDWAWLVLKAPQMDEGMRIVIRTVERHPRNAVAFGTPYWLP